MELILSINHVDSHIFFRLLDSNDEVILLVLSFILPYIECFLLRQWLWINFFVWYFGNLWNLRSLGHWNFWYGRLFGAIRSRWGTFQFHHTIRGVWRLNALNYFRWTLISITSSCKWYRSIWFPVSTFDRIKSCFLGGSLGLNPLTFLVGCNSRWLWWLSNILCLLGIFHHVGPQVWLDFSVDDFFLFTAIQF